MVLFCASLMAPVAPMILLAIFNFFIEVLDARAAAPFLPTLPLGMLKIVNWLFAANAMALTWSSKLTHLVKLLFSLSTTSLQIDSDSHNRDTNASDNCYKTSKCSLEHPVALHTLSGTASIAHAPA